MKCLLIFTVLALSINCHLWANPLQGIRIRRNALRNESKLWPKGIVPYTIHKSFTPEERGVIHSAIKTIRSVSCIRFKKHSYENDYVEIVKGDRCWSAIGRWGGCQNVILGDGCITLGTLTHELMHTIGFYHEHVRPDRDDYVTVVKDNIRTDRLYNFNKKSFKDVTTFGLPYDFKSILHYKSTAFAKDKKKMSLKAIDDSASLGSTGKMTKTDIWKINKLYHCFDKYKVYG